MLAPPRKGTKAAVKRYNGITNDLTGFLTAHCATGRNAARSPQRPKQEYLIS